MIRTEEISGFLNLKAEMPLIDVRSPGEYAIGHIPGAVNIPLFSDEERAKVGTLYKQSGKEAALFLGLDFVGPKMSGFIKKLKSLIRGKTNKAALYCWRGGMRSSSMAWLFSTAGFDATLLQGGYKAYRTYIRQQSGSGAPIFVLGGMTGSGKTEVLHQLQKMGQQVIDLENLAHNKGSVFGYLGQPPQPTNEQFENLLFEEWSKLDPSKPVWLEDESRSIGAVGQPPVFFDRMKLSPLILLRVPSEIRVKRLLEEYTGFDKMLLQEALEKISRPLGGEGIAEARKEIQEGDFAPAIRLVLKYYDKTYEKALQKFNQREITELHSETGDAEANANMILSHLRNRQML